MKNGFPSHVDLTVTDLARSSAFYGRLLEWLGYESRPDVGAGAPCWAVGSPATGYFAIALKEATVSGPSGVAHDRNTPGLHHLAFHVKARSEVESLHDFLREAGVTILDAPCEYEYTPGYYAVFFEDPDGIKLEVVHEPVMFGNG